MNQQIIFSLVTTSFFVLFSLSAIGQKDAEKVTPFKAFTGYTDPCTSDFTPAIVPKNEALSEATANAAAAGFSSAFFAPSELLTLVNQNGSIGVRFYNAIESTSTASFVIAVAVKPDGSEINPAFKKSYYQSQPVGSKGVLSKLISGGAASNYVTNMVSANNLTAASAFFPKSTITEIASTNCAGIKVIPGSRKFQLNAASNNEVGSHLCFMISGVASDLSEMESSYYKSLEPCPTVCPNDKLMLGSQK